LYAEGPRRVRQLYPQELSRDFGLCQFVKIHRSAGASRADCTPAANVRGEDLFHSDFGGGGIGAEGGSASGGATPSFAFIFPAIFRRIRSYSVWVISPFSNISRKLVRLSPVSSPASRRFRQRSANQRARAPTRSR